MIMYEKIPMLQTFQDFPSVPVTLVESHLNWHALKGFATDYHCASYYDCSDDCVWENANIFVEFLSALVIVTLDESQRNWHDLKGRATKYICAKFHDCTGHSAWENVNVWVFQDFQSATVAMTLDEGHSNWYGLKCLTTKYHCVKFHDCSGHSVWENVNVWVFQDFPSAAVAMTLDEGQPKRQGLKRLATKNNCAKFHDCSGDSFWENVYV